MLSEGSTLKAIDPLIINSFPLLIVGKEYIIEEIIEGCLVIKVESGGHFPFSIIKEELYYYRDYFVRIDVK